MTGIVFLIPGRTASRPGPLPPTIDDAAVGTSPASGGDEGLLSWEQVEALVSDNSAESFGFMESDVSSER